MSKQFTANLKWNVNEGSINRLRDRHLKRSLAGIERVIDDYAAGASRYIAYVKILTDASTGTAWHRNENALRGNNENARFETGNMFRSVGYESYSFDATFKIGAEFGLPTIANGGERYFMEQEYGFKQVNKGGARYVKGMGSGAAAIKHMRPQFRKQMLQLGFLSGKKDARGTQVMKLQRAGIDFNQAWSATFATNMTAESRQKRNDIIKRMQARELATYVKSLESKKVIASFSIGGRSAALEQFRSRLMGNGAAPTSEAGF